LLLLVSPGQINYITPSGLANGPAAMMLKDESGNTINVGFLNPDWQRRCDCRSQIRLYVRQSDATQNQVTGFIKWGWQHLVI
jgi:hypothetical protein